MCGPLHYASRTYSIDARRGPSALELTQCAPIYFYYSGKRGFALKSRATHRLAEFSARRAGVLIVCAVTFVSAGFSLMQPPAALAAAGCTNPTGELGDWANIDNKWYVCKQLAEGLFAWRPVDSGEPGAVAIVSPDVQEEHSSSAVTTFSVSVQQDAGRSLSVTMSYGDGASASATIPPGSASATVTFSHGFYQPIPIGTQPSVGAYAQTATVAQTGASASASTTVHAC